MSPAIILGQYGKRSTYFAVAFGRPDLEKVDGKKRNPKFLTHEGRLALFRDQIDAMNSAILHPLHADHVPAVAELDRAAAEQLAKWMSAPADGFSMDGRFPMGIDEMFYREIVLDPDAPDASGHIVL